MPQDIQYDTTTEYIVASVSVQVTTPMPSGIDHIYLQPGEEVDITLKKVDKNTKKIKNKD